MNQQSIHHVSITISGGTPEERGDLARAIELAVRGRLNPRRHLHVDVTIEQDDVADALAHVPSPSDSRTNNE